MPYKVSPVVSNGHPPVGTFIDDGSLELVELLGVGGYGVVFRAEDTCSFSPKSYAVKCLPHCHLQSRQRQTHIREIALHQIASAHPNVVTLHRVVETFDFTFIIMDYAPDHDLFSQILNNCRYLGDSELIKHVFLQVLDAVEYCHSLGIYHRDLKPENILCFEGGLRVAITDFGLATTDRVSEEFRTGSIYHMSPECQGGEFACTGTYSPMFNDIWSLGIILLNLATGRNPWKSASLSDPTFMAYVRDPFNFLPTVLPISFEANALLTRMLELDWRDRMTLSELRESLDDITSFYSDNVVFEGSMARCPWESGMDIDCESSKGEVSRLSEPQELKSRWSTNSSSDIIFASRSLTVESSYGAPWNSYANTTWAFEPQSPSEAASPERPSTPESPFSPASSLSPLTPKDVMFGNRVNRERKPLTLDTKMAQPHYYNGNASIMSHSTTSSEMQTAVEYDPYSSSFFLASPASPLKSSANAVTELRDLASSMWNLSETSRSTPTSRYSSIKSSISEEITVVPRSSAPSPDTVVWPDHSLEILPPLESPILPPIRPTSPAKKLYENSRVKSASIFNHFHLFPKQSPPPSQEATEPTCLPSPFASFTFSERPSSPIPVHSWVNLYPRSNSPASRVAAHRTCRRAAYLRSPRHWLTGKLFSSN
ncbi:kinase-like domain-containing protein [Mycena floridula]|nr:kinase-like domain-containing protein [Mycena floridula]